MGYCLSKKSNDIIEHVMSKFLYRVIRHDFIVSHIEDYIHKDLKSYYDFFNLTKILGIHTDLHFQITYWEDCYVNFVNKNGIDGILLVPLLLCNGTLKAKLNYVKLYLAVNINHSKDKDACNNLIINLNIFKKIIYSFFACLTHVACKAYIKSHEHDYNENDAEFYKNDINDNNINNEEMKYYKDIFSEKNIENFTLYLLKPYTKKNFYVNAGKFFDENIEFLTNDKKIRNYIRQHIKNINNIINVEENNNIDLNNTDNIINEDNNNNNIHTESEKNPTNLNKDEFKKTYTNNITNNLTKTNTNINNKI